MKKCALMHYSIKLFISMIPIRCKVIYYEISIPFDRYIISTIFLHLNCKGKNILFLDTNL